MWPFRKKPALANAWFGDIGFRLAWEDKHARLPQPGAQAFAWETYQLAEFTLIGPTVAVRRKWSVIQPAQVHIGLAVPLAGNPLIAGQIFHQPLYNPNTGTSG
jgi:hypothetical protein